MVPSTSQANAKYTELKLGTFFLRGKHTTYNRGEILIDPSGHREEMFFLLSGYVKVYYIDKMGGQKIYMIYRPKDPFPVTNILDLNLPVYFEAINEVRLTKVPTQEFNSFIESDPKITSYLLRRLAYAATTLTERISNLQHTEAHQRVAHNVLWLARHLGKHNGKRYVITAPITHQIIADSSNVSRETATRSLKKLTESGLITYKTNRFVIPDIERFVNEIE